MKNKLIERIPYYPRSNEVIEIEERRPYFMNGVNVVFTNKDNLRDLEDLESDVIIIAYNPFNPVVLKSVLNKTIEVTKENGATFVTSFLQYTIKRVDRHKIVKETYDRDEYRQIQLRSMSYKFFKEQIIGHNFLKKILNLPHKNNLIRKIDDKIKKVVEIIPKW